MMAVSPSLPAHPAEPSTAIPKSATTSTSTGRKNLPLWLRTTPVAWTKISSSRRVLLALEPAVPIAKTNRTLGNRMKRAERTSAMKTKASLQHLSLQRVEKRIKAIILLHPGVGVVTSQLPLPFLLLPLLPLPPPALSPPTTNHPLPTPSLTGVPKRGATRVVLPHSGRGWSGKDSGLALVSCPKSEWAMETKANVE